MAVHRRARVRGRSEGGRGRSLSVSGTLETVVGRFVAAYVIPHPASVICHPAFAICHFSFPIPRSEFRIPHFLTEGATHSLAPRKRGWALSPRVAAGSPSVRI